MMGKLSKDTVKVFLGGTCGIFDWRSVLMSDTKDSGLFFINPVVLERSQEEIYDEIRHRQESDLCLYCITPEIKGVYSIAEVVEDSIKKPKGSTLFYLYDETTFYMQNKDIEKPLRYVSGSSYSFDDLKDMLRRNSAKVFNTYDELVLFLNAYMSMREHEMELESLAYTE